MVGIALGGSLACPRAPEAQAAIETPVKSCKQSRLFIPRPQSNAAGCGQCERHARRPSALVYVLLLAVARRRAGAAWSSAGAWNEATVA
ncbi:hypothetical protein GCM10007857_28030 [Bradyrhizobium iriomotense]|uniref:Secreted protein n=1 Tax=Bradyrhizobium iriomotense TaxID=441950 RepID=A0ABQ6AV38_9BRAD|nr:hypothetical protein GCM10007857_28030 [Bradyrhizobium iriomotense]